MAKATVCSRLQGGHRRAGRFIPDSQIEIDVTDDAIKVLQADPNVIIVVAETPAAPPPSADSKKK